MNELQIKNTNLEQVNENLPVLPSLDVLTNRADRIFLKGLKAMEDLIDYSVEEQTRIKAFSTVIQFGKYIEERKQNMDSDNGILDDMTEIVQDE